MHALLSSPDYDDALEPYAAVARRAVQVDGESRPWVLANMVCGIDGSTAVAGRVGPLSSPADAALFKRLRSVADLVLVGAATVRQERYGPVRIADDLRESRQAAGRAPVPPIAVVTRSVGFDWSTPLFTADDAPTPIIVTCEHAGEAALAEAAEHAHVVVAGIDRVDVGRALAILHERGHDVVLCEGGATLLGELASADLLDELCLTISPLMGGDSLPVARASEAPSLRAFRLAHVGREDDVLFLRYERGSADR